MDNYRRMFDTIKITCSHRLRDVTCSDISRKMRLCECQHELVIDPFPVESIATHNYLHSVVEEMLYITISCFEVAEHFHHMCSMC